MVKKNLVFWNEIKDLPFPTYLQKITPTCIRSVKVKKNQLTDSMIIKKVRSKMDEGDFRGAITILTSNDTIAPFKVDTYMRLLQKHPAPNVPVLIGSSPQTVAPVLESEISVAIFRFQNGSAG